MRKFILLLLLPVLISCGSEKKIEYQVDKSIYDDVEFEMPKVKLPSFSNYKVNIVDFGAVPDGKTINTEAINKAIEDVSNKGGGMVIIPRGLWLTGPIVLKSNINLHASDGALVIFSNNFDLYPIIETSFEGLNTFRCQSPIYARDAENIAITGKGLFDGSGDSWRPVKKAKITEYQWRKFISRGGVLNEKETTWYPSQQALDGVKYSRMNVPANFKTKADYEKIKDFLRPVMLSFINCKKVLLDGVCFQNSPAWCLHPLMCEDITIRNLTVRNPSYAQNGDGLDVESCKNAVIYNCNFDVGDDGICFKSGKDEDGRERGIPDENIIVKNCVVYHGHGGFVVGSEMSGGMKNIHISNCTFIGTDIGLRFKSNRGRGGVIENIYVSNIDMIDILTEAVRFNMFYGGNSPIPEPEQKEVDKDLLKTEEVPVTEKTPIFKDIFIRGIVCQGARRAIDLEGLPEMNLKNVVLEDIQMETSLGLEAKDVKGLTINNLVLNVEKGPVMYLNNAKDVKVTNLKYGCSCKDIVHIKGNLTENIKFVKSDFHSIEDEITIDENVLNKHVVFE